MVIDRRQFLAGAGVAALSATPAFAQAPRKPDHRIVIAPVSLEIAPGHVIKTVGYNGSVPGPLLRLREGQDVAIAITNKSDSHELVHWHGLAVPSDVDGAMEEGTPMLMPGETRSYRFTAKPAGTRW